MTPATTPAPARPAYRVLKILEIGGRGSWDYLTLDRGGRRLYIPRGDHVIVLDTESGKVIGDVVNTPGIHGVAIDEAGKGYTSNGGGNSVTVFEVATFALRGLLPAGKDPDAILYDPASQRVFAFNARSGDATAIDVASNAVAGTLPLDGSPEFAVADGTGTIYVNLEDKNEVVALGSMALKVVRRSALTGCQAPTGLAFDPERKRLFSVCANKKMVVSEAETGKIVASLPIGGGVDGAAFDVERRLAFSSNGEGSLTIVRETGTGGYEVAQTLPTLPGARTLVLDPGSHRIYLAATTSAGSFVILVVGD